MKKYITISMLLLGSILNANDSTRVNYYLELHNNYRNAKIDTMPFDWYVGAKTAIHIDSLINISLSGSIERDNGKIYYMHSEKLTYKYGEVSYTYDTENFFNFASGSIYYPYKIINLGYNILIDENFTHSIHLGIKWRWVEISSSFLDKINKIEYSIRPNFKIKEKISVGYKVKGLYINNKHKWNAGFTIKMKI